MGSFFYALWGMMGSYSIKGPTVIRKALLHDFSNLVAYTSK